MIEPDEHEIGFRSAVAGPGDRQPRATSWLFGLGVVLVRFATGAIVLCASSTSPDLPNQHLDRDVAGICDVLAWVGCPRVRGAWPTTFARATTPTSPCFCSGDPTLLTRCPATSGNSLLDR